MANGNKCQQMVSNAQQMLYTFVFAIPVGFYFCLEGFPNSIALPVPLLRQFFSEALEAWYLLCFRHISWKLGSQVWVCILDWFWGRFGVPFGRLLGGFLGTLATLWANLGRLGGSF